MANFIDDRFRSPFDGPGPRFETPTGPPMIGPPVGIPPLIGPPVGAREIPIGIRPPMPSIGPALTPAQRLAMIFRRAQGNPMLVRRLRNVQNPILARGIARRRGF